MALDQSVLTQLLLSTFSSLASAPTQPTGEGVSAEAASKISSAYASYAASAMAGALTPTVVPPDALALESSLVGSDLALGLTSGIKAYWSQTQWAAPGFVPSNPIVPDLPQSIDPMEQELRATFDKMTSTSATVDTAAAEIAAIVHNYTMKLKVSSTTLEGVTAPVNVM